MAIPEAKSAWMNIAGVLVTNSSSVRGWSLGSGGSGIAGTDELKAFQEEEGGPDYI